MRRGLIEPKVMWALKESKDPLSNQEPLEN